MDAGCSLRYLLEYVSTVAVLISLLHLGLPAPLALAPNCRCMSCPIPLESPL